MKKESIEESLGKVSKEFKKEARRLFADKGYWEQMERWRQYCDKKTEEELIERGYKKGQEIS